VRAFENKVLWRILRPQRKEVAGGWRRLHNEELLLVFFKYSSFFFN
jgi:hypothetical protein